MAQRTLCCSKAGFRPSTNVYDVRKEIFPPNYVEAVDNTLDFNLNYWEVQCPLGYEQRKVGDKRRCVYKEMPYPTFYRGHDIFKAKVLEKLNNS